MSESVFATIWQEAWIAIRHPRQYLRWAFQPLSRSIKYLALLNLVMAIVTSVYLFANVRPQLQAFGEWAAGEIPLVTYEDGILHIENDKAFTFASGDQYFFKIDPTQSKEDNPAIDSFYTVGALFTSDQIVIRQGEEVERIPYTDMRNKAFSFTGQDLKRVTDKTGSLFFLLISFLILFSYFMIAKLLYSAFFAVLYFVFTGVKYDFKHLWNMAIYALTPAMLAGYLSFILYPVSGLYTMVFIFYFFFAMTVYQRFQYFKAQRTKVEN